VTIIGWGAKSASVSSLEPHRPQFAPDSIRPDFTRFLAPQPVHRRVNTAPPSSGFKGALHLPQRASDAGREAAIRFLAPHCPQRTILVSSVFMAERAFLSLRSKASSLALLRQRRTF
jgi:hypothetical protein